jgi:hypothetical protein
MGIETEEEEEVLAKAKTAVSRARFNGLQRTR